MSLFPNKFLLNILACGLILSYPLRTVAATSDGEEYSFNFALSPSAEKSKPTETPVNKLQVTETKLIWTNYRFPQSGFSIDFPKKPEYVQQTIDVPKSGLKINYETYLSEPSDDLVFVVSVWNYPAQIDMPNPEVNLQEGFSGMLSALPGSEVISMQKTEVGGFKAVEFWVRNDNIHFQGQLILVHNTLYQVFTVYKNTQDMGNNYPHFIHSFKLIDPEKRKAAPPSKSSSTSRMSI